MSRYIHNSHTVSVLLSQLVCPAKDRRAVCPPDVDALLNEMCLDSAKRYELVFLESGTDDGHVHVLVQSVPTSSPTTIVQMVKPITAREILQRTPAIKRTVSGGA